MFVGVMLNSQQQIPEFCNNAFQDDRKPFGAFLSKLETAFRAGVLQHDRVEALTLGIPKRRQDRLVRVHARNSRVGYPCP